MYFVSIIAVILIVLFETLAMIIFSLLYFRR